MAARLRKKSRPLRPISTNLTSTPGRSVWKRCAPLIRLVLNAPARPLSAVIRTSRMRFSSRRASSGFSAACSSLASAAATLPSTLRRSEPYGRAAMQRSWARRSFAAETIFMALVICCVFLTERMRRRISIKLGIWFCRRVLRHEARLELFDNGLDLGSEIRVEDFLGADFVQHGALRVIQKAVQLRFEPAAHLHREIVQVPLGSRPDDNDLLFDGNGRILFRFQDLDRCLPRLSCCWEDLSRSLPNCANAASSRYCARSRRMPPAMDFMALVCALPPTRLTEIPTLMAGRWLLLNRSASRKICPSVIEITLVGM